MLSKKFSDAVSYSVVAALVNTKPFSDAAMPGGVFLECRVTFLFKFGKLFSPRKHEIR